MQPFFMCLLVDSFHGLDPDFSSKRDRDFFAFGALLAKTEFFLEVLSGGESPEVHIIKQFAVVLFTQRGNIGLKFQGYD